MKLLKKSLLITTAFIALSGSEDSPVAPENKPQDGTKVDTILTIIEDS